jgi:hypothetical protein
VEGAIVREYLGFFFLIMIALCTSAIAQSENPFGSANEDLSSLRGDIYYLPEGASALPNFSTLTPVGSIYTKTLDVPQRSFDSGFPGVTDRFEWFAIRYTGSFQVDQEGEYSFRLVSDDGSRLFIDGNKIIDNDGTHAPASVSGSAYLTRGTHQMEVDYFQGPRQYVALQLFWTPPGGSETISSPQYVPVSSSSGSSSLSGTSTGSSQSTSGLNGLDLTGVWDCNDGGTYYLRQLDDILWWFGEPSYEPGVWSNVATGIISDDIIYLDWSDVPKGSLMNSGYLVLDIVSSDRLVLLDMSGGFGGSVWTRRGSSSGSQLGTSTSASPGMTGAGSGAGTGSSTSYANPWEDPSIRILIDEWLQQQDWCLKEIYGPVAFIDQWGRACGDLDTTTVRCDLTPDHPADWDSYHYLWYNNWCPENYPFTVQDYVQMRQNGRSFDDLMICKSKGEDCY